MNIFKINGFGGAFMKSSATREFDIGRLIGGGVEVFSKSETISTSTDAKSHTLACSSGDYLFIADKQLGGRGRQGKSFSSPSGGLYMTLSLECELDIGSALRSTSCAAVAVLRAAERLYSVSLGIKWVNDIYAEHDMVLKKLGGILVEAVNDYEKMITKRLLFGIGINLLVSPLVEGNDTVSLSELGIPFDNISREALAAEITRELLTFRDGGFDFSSVRSEYEEKSVLIGKEISFSKNGTLKNGFALGVSECGGLIVETDGNKEELNSGEVSVRINR